MKASDSTNSLTALNQDPEEGIQTCFICLDEINDKQEPLVDSSLLRNCGCRFKVHPDCWNGWMKDKTDYDCPICRKKSLTSGKPPRPPAPGIDEWPTEINTKRRLYIGLSVCTILLGASIMIYKIVTEQ